MKTTFAYQCLHHKTYAKYLRFETYKTAHVIHPIGSTIDEFGIVVDGCLKAEKFPEFLYFTGKKLYTYSLVAVKKTEVAWISTSVFERMLEEDHDMMYAFMLYISKRGMKNQALLNCLYYQTIAQRVAFWLVSMNNLGQNERIPLPKSQTIWANTLHVSRSSLNQEIKRMEKEGYFRIEGHTLILLDKEGLEQLL